MKGNRNGRTVAVIGGVPAHSAEKAGPDRAGTKLVLAVTVDQGRPSKAGHRVSAGATAANDANDGAHTEGQPMNAASPQLRCRRSKSL